MTNIGVVRSALLLVGLATAGVAQGFSLTLQEALDRTEQTSTVRSAKIVVEVARANIGKLEYNGDLSLSFAPQAKATTQLTMPFPEQTELSGVLSAKLPVGLSGAAKLQVTAARAALQTAELKLRQVTDSAYELVYGLYMQAWLAQEEKAVLETELTAARAYASALEEQFQAGKISLVELTSAEEDLRNKEAAASKGELEHRLSWLRLSTALSLPLTADTPDLLPDPAISKSLTLPKPPELVSWALERDADLRAADASIGGIDGQMALARRPDISSSIQLSGGVADHSFSLSYAFDQPQLGASYAIPFYSEGSIPGSNSGNSTDTWNAGISVSLGFAAGKRSSLELDSLRALRDQSAAKLDDLRNSLQLDVRSRYQEWLTATEEIARAKSVVARTERNEAIVQSRKKLGLASDYEVLQAGALLDRARFSILSVESTARINFLRAANSAVYLQNVIDMFEKGGQE